MRKSRVLMAAAGLLLGAGRAVVRSCMSANLRQLANLGLQACRRTQRARDGARLRDRA